MSVDNIQDPEVKKAIQDILDAIKINCGKLGKIQETVDGMPLKIKQDLFPQLITEVRNSIRSELSNKF